MEARVLASFFSLWASLLFSGEASLLFQSDFALNTQLRGWVDVYQKSPPKFPDNYQVVTEEGKTFLQTGEVMFGLSHKLRQPIKVDDSISLIQIAVMLRQPKEFTGHQLSIALSSRATVAADAGQAFWRLRDSGFIANGYIHNLQGSNFIAYQKEGRQTRSSRPIAPFGLLSAHDQWQEWILIYDHQQKQLKFYHEPAAATPYLRMYYCDLSNIELNSVWLGAWGTQYRNVTVSVIYNTEK